MKTAKKRHFKRVPDFWKILKGEPTLADATVGYKGRITMDKSVFYCPYIPLQFSRVANTTDNATLHVTFKTRYNNEQTAI